MTAQLGLHGTGCFISVCIWLQCASKG